MGQDGIVDAMKPVIVAGAGPVGAVLAADPACVDVSPADLLQAAITC